jgi:hypothetical protein
MDKGLIALHSAFDIWDSTFEHQHVVTVEIKCIIVCRNTTVFSNCWRKQLHVLAFSGWAIIRLRLEYRRKHIYCTTMWTSRMGEQDLVLQCLGRCVTIYTRCGICDGYDFVCRVLCGFDMWAGVIFGSCFCQSVLGGCGEDSWVCEVTKS